MDEKVRALLKHTERVVSTFGPYHATSDRILLVTQNRVGLLVRDLPYSKVTGVETVSTPNRKLMGVGVLIGVGAVGAALAWSALLGVVGLAAGAYVFSCGAVGRPAYYQIQGRDVPASDVWMWRVRYRGAGSFIATIRTILGQGPRF